MFHRSSISCKSLLKIEIRCSTIRNNFLIIISLINRRYFMIFSGKLVTNSQVVSLDQCTISLRRHARRRSLCEDTLDLARGRRENAVAAKYLRTQIKVTFVHKESSTRATLKRNIATEWCAKTHLHKCSSRYAAFILQRGVHRRANTLSRHKYLVGEQGRSLNPGGERSAGRRLRVHTSRRSMVFDDPISWLSRGGRWTDGRGVGVRAYRTFKSRTRVTVIYMDGGLANLPYASLCL